MKLLSNIDITWNPTFVRWFVTVLYSDDTQQKEDFANSVDMTVWVNMLIAAHTPDSADVLSTLEGVIGHD